LCIDYRQLNEHSERDAYPVPRMDHILNQLREAKYISTLDLKSGYWQIPMDKGSKQFTAFTVPGRGLYQWKVMPFGLHTAPATFQRALDSVIGPEMEPFAFAYLDDIVVIGRTKREHMEKLQEVMNRLRKANLKINTEKCHFFKEELKYLGHVPLPETLRGIQETFAAEASAACSWFQGMCVQIRTQPQKYPDYVMEGENLYRSIPQRSGSEDVISWKIYVPRDLRETVLKE
ncbi:hypothetical protein KR084_011488, partial [Drosophila pseudotakahashii]